MILNEPFNQRHHLCVCTANCPSSRPCHSFAQISPNFAPIHRDNVETFVIGVFGCCQSFSRKAVKNNGSTARPSTELVPMHKTTNTCWISDIPVRTPTHRPRFIQTLISGVQLTGRRSTLPNHHGFRPDGQIRWFNSGG